MKTKQLIANVQSLINAPIDKVWEAFVNPETIKKYMFGTTVTSDWKEGSPIIWRGEWKGKSYEDKGVIIKIKPKSLLQYTHFSPLTGVPDLPENYHTVTIQITPKGQSTSVLLSQDNNETNEAREHSEKNWAGMFEGLKKVLE